MATVSRTRNDGRACDQIRPVTVTYDRYGFAQASVLLELGDTKVLCGVSLQQGVPPFLKGKKTGWLKAEYAMLPIATQVRTQRESSVAMRNGRSVEISRMVGRSLRSMVNLDALGERTLVIDCDVLQADGSTRTACITAASLALCTADKRWVAQGILARSCITDPVVGVSIGVMQDNLLVDLTYEEDSVIDADFNFVVTRTGALVEVQGTAERLPVARHLVEKTWVVAMLASQQLFALFIDNGGIATERKASKATAEPAQGGLARQQPASPFSLGARFHYESQDV